MMQFPYQELIQTYLVLFTFSLSCIFPKYSYMYNRNTEIAVCSKLFTYQIQSGRQNFEWRIFILARHQLSEVHWNHRNDENRAPIEYPTEEELSGNSL